jgi:GTP-binding protein Era
VVAVVNKVDVARQERILEQLDEAGTWDFAAYVPVSALEKDGTERLLDEIDNLLIEGPQFFPSDIHMDQPDRLYAAELIREKFLHRLRDELPHSLAIVVEEIEPRDNDVVYVGASAYVERKSQKGIVIGKGGSLLREVGAEARSDLERFFGSRVYLDIRVKVEEDWQRRDQTLDRLGF